jgi:hypothetical protein
MIVAVLQHEIMLFMQLTSNQLPLCLFVLWQKPERVSRAAMIIIS